MTIVDNNSADNTKQLISEYRPYLPFATQYVFEKKQGLAAARNGGLRHTGGEIVVWTDDDCIADPHWLVRIAELFRSRPHLAVLGGRVELYDQAHYPMTIKRSLVEEFGNPNVEPGEMILGCNMAMRRCAVDALGGFDERFGAGAPMRSAEDVDFLMRAQAARLEMMYSPDVLLFHNHGRCTEEAAKSLRSAYMYGRGALFMKHTLGGHPMARRWFYWQLRRLLLNLCGPIGSGRRPSAEFSLLRDYVLGAAALGIGEFRLLLDQGFRRKERSLENTTLGSCNDVKQLGPNNGRPPAQTDDAREDNAQQMVEVVFCVNELYLQHVAVALVSLLEHNPNVSVRVHIILCAASLFGEKRLLDSIERYDNVDVLFYCFDKGRISQLNTSWHITVETYIRLFLPEILRFTN